MNNLIEADSDTLLQQASMTAENYLRKAVEAIDGMYGEGYAKANPELIAAFMEVAASDFNAAILAKVIEQSMNQIANGIADITRLRNGE